MRLVIQKKQMSPVLLPACTSIAPDFILHWIKCNGKAQFDRCNSHRCNCVVNNMLFTQISNFEYYGTKCVCSQDVGIVSDDGGELSIEKPKDVDE